MSHLRPTCPHCGEQDCHTRNIRTATCRMDGEHGYIVQGAHGRHASAREDYLTDECAVAEAQREEWKRLALARTASWLEELLVVRNLRDEIERLRCLVCELGGEPGCDGGAP